MTTEEIFSKLQTLIAEQFAINEDEITMDTSFTDDLCADSVDLMELVLTMEQVFGIEETNEEELAQLKTVGSCVKFLADKLN